MFITMVGDGTAFASLVFGYFFYWTIHPDFTAGQAGPGMAMADGGTCSIRCRLGRHGGGAANSMRAARRVSRGWRSLPPPC